jgi:hypothetical protein
MANIVKIGEGNLFTLTLENCQKIKPRSIYGEIPPLNSEDNPGNLLYLDKQFFVNTQNIVNSNDQKRANYINSRINDLYLEINEYDIQTKIIFGIKDGIMSNLKDIIDTYEDIVPLDLKKANTPSGKEERIDFLTKRQKQLETGWINIPNNPIYTFWDLGSWLSKLENGNSYIQGKVNNNKFALEKENIAQANRATDSFLDSNYSVKRGISGIRESDLRHDIAQKNYQTNVNDRLDLFIKSELNDVSNLYTKYKLEYDEYSANKSELSSLHLRQNEFESNKPKPFSNLLVNESGHEKVKALH